MIKISETALVMLHSDTDTAVHVLVGRCRLRTLGLRASSRGEEEEQVPLPCILTDCICEAALRVKR